MQILFSHQNFPAQFGSFGAYLARNGWEVSFFSENDTIPPPPGCKLFKMTPHRKPTEGVHRFAKPLEQAMINGQAFANTAIAALDTGLKPDVVVAHSGWGSGTFAKAVWPECKYVSYVEWFYRWPGLDKSHRMDEATSADDRARALARNAPTLLDLVEADMVFCPTNFQAAQFPDWLRERIKVMHDGVDTARLAPNPSAKMPVLALDLPPDAEIVTYATRGMEPHRGFPDFMRAIALLQKSRPKLHALIGGEDRVAYGAKLPAGQSWKQIMLDELDLDESRLHWTGLLPRDQWLKLLQATHVHIYLTVPFILSWSMIEAMSVACPMVVSNTAPVLEAMTPDVTGLVVDHVKTEELAAAIARLLDDRALAKRLGAQARWHVKQNYDASWIYPSRAWELANLVRAPDHMKA